MDLRNEYGLISTSGHHWERDGSRQKPDDYLHPTKMLILSTDLFSVLTQSVVFYIVHYIKEFELLDYMVQSLKHSTVMISLLTATRTLTNYISYQLYHQKEKYFKELRHWSIPKRLTLKCNKKGSRNNM